MSHMLLRIRLVVNDTSIVADEITLIINLSNSRQHSLLQPLQEWIKEFKELDTFLLTCFMLPLLEYYLLHKF